MTRTNLESWIEKTEGFNSLTRENLEVLQLRRLNELLCRERARNGLYKSLPEKINSLRELENLPFTTAQELSQSGGALLLTSQSEVQRIISGATSGTTGPAKRVFYTAADLAQTVGFFAAGISEFAGTGDRVMITMPFSGPYGLGELIAEAVENLDARPIRAGIGLTLGEYAGIMDTERPDCFIGTAANLLGILRYAGRKSLKFALISGDACPDGVVEEIEKILGARLFPHYGSRECGLGGAVTCQAHEGMHIRENHIIAEIVSPDGNPLPDGEWGELVITTIGQEAQPLLRYKTGDRSRILPAACPCGGVTKRLDSVRRLSPRENKIASLDDKIFRLPGLIDWSLKSGKAIALCTPQADISAVKNEISSLTGAKVTARQARPDSKFLYSAKRML